MRHRATNHRCQSSAVTLAGQSLCPVPGLHCIKVSCHAKIRYGVSRPCRPRRKVRRSLAYNLFFRPLYFWEPDQRGPSHAPLEIGKNLMEVYKTAARSLRSRLKELGVGLTHSQALEGVAAVHGQRNWQTLQATPSKGMDTDLRKYVLSAMGCSPAELVAFGEGDAAVFAAIKRDDGTVNCHVVVNARPDTVYYEGDACNCTAPANVLDALTPSADSMVNCWRQSARIYLERQARLRTRDLSLGLPWFSHYPLKCGIKDAHFCVATDESGLNFEVTNGKKTAKVTLPHSDAIRLMPLALHTENLLDEVEISIRLGNDHPTQIILGPPTHPVLMLFNSEGGLVAWSGIPFHQKMTTPYD